MKTAFTSTLALVALSVSATCASAATYRLACPSAETSTTCLAATHFADEVRENSGGEIDIQVFPGGQLGSGEKAIQQMRAGVLDLVVESLSNYGNFVDDFNVVSWGFTFRDNAHFQSFLASDVEKEMEAQLFDEAGIKMLASNWSKLPRVVVSTRPVETPEDLAGLKFRVPGIPSYIKTWQTLGANPTQVPWADSFQALKTGITDAMEAPYDSVLSQKFHLAAPYVSLTDHVYDSVTVSMNGMRWSRLDEAQQQVMLEAAANAASYSAELVAEAAKTVSDQLEADGATIIEVDRSAFADKLRAAAEEQEAEGLWAEGLYDAIQSID
ncbi:TRAP transporter substrate-binding protein [Celeribacter indicus]|uniref:TRAP dicarboxylate transporter subunit DctP n=1 Tax=Celeribacter indicus TaxID=1208324 RepID=A0A0B5E8T7_9RHOB|nr:TRAP transporter substrate-binding protein [Celeribacter indicus]AJE48722.1 TRAP dicarboxylate transporter subunit DctP [Celeribacter indicus]SDX12116.1 tripartite ATP-independent transporter solute receptor, DctP family [Celeribacter indicus]